MPSSSLGRLVSANLFTELGGTSEVRDEKDCFSHLKILFNRFENLLSNERASLGTQLYSSRIRRVGEKGAKKSKIAASVLANSRGLSGKYG